MPELAETARVFCLTAAVAAVGYAVFTDLRARRIPNWVPVCLIILLIPAALLGEVGVKALLVDHLATGLLVLGVGICVFAMGWAGGGDVKLIAALAAWAGWELLLPYLFATALLGGALALLLLLFRSRYGRALFERSSTAAGIIKPDEEVPYAVAIGGAALFFMIRSL